MDILCLKCGVKTAALIPTPSATSKAGRRDEPPVNVADRRGSQRVWALLDARATRCRTVVLYL
jgi:hypothetical protein